MPLKRDFIKCGCKDECHNLQYVEYSDDGCSIRILGTALLDKWPLAIGLATDRQKMADEMADRLGKDLVAGGAPPPLLGMLFIPKENAYPSPWIFEHATWVFEANEDDNLDWVDADHLDDGNPEC